MKTIKLLFVAIIGSLLSVSCLVDDDAPKQEFATTPHSVGFNRSAINHVITPAQTSNIEESVHINLIGGMHANNSNSDIVLSYQVDPSSTAIAGTHYNITNTGNQFTIPAGTNFTSENFNYEVIPSALNIGESLDLIINLVPISGNVIAAAQFAPLVINMTKCDPPLDGNYTVQNFSDPADPTYTVPNGNASVMTATGCNTYSINILEPFSTDYTWQISHDPTTNAITITGWDFQGGNPLTGSGTYNPATSTLSFNDLNVAGVPWYVDFDFDLVLNP